MLYSTPICTDHHRFSTGRSHTLSNNFVRSSIPTPTAHSSQGFDHHLKSFNNSYPSNGGHTSSQHDRTPSSQSRAVPLVHCPDLPRAIPLEQFMADRSRYQKRDYSTDSHTSSLPSPPSPPTQAPPTPAPLPPPAPPQVNFNHLDSLSSNSLTAASAKLLKTM